MKTIIYTTKDSCLQKISYFKLRAENDLKKGFKFGNEKSKDMCSYLCGRFIPDSGSDPESGIPAGISGDKFSRTEQNRKSGKFSIPAPDIQLNPSIYIIKTLKKFHNL